MNETEARDGKYVRAIAEAAKIAQQADSNLQARIAEALAAGESWTVIRVALGAARPAIADSFQQSSNPRANDEATG